MQSSDILSSIQPIENNVEPIVTQTGMIARSMLIIIIPILVIVAVIIIVAVCCSKGKKNKQNEK